MKKDIAYSIIINLFCFLNIFSADTSTTSNPLIRAAATEHNQSSVLLMKIPQDIRGYIFAEHVISGTSLIDRSIKDALNLSATCTHFDQMLPYFGKLLQSYDFDLRKKTMDKMLSNVINDGTYWNNRRSMLLFAHAGYREIYSKFVDQDDYEILKVVLEDGADPNKYDALFKCPIFFYIKTPEIAQLFINHGANLQLRSTGWANQNILEHLTAGLGCSHQKIDLIALYIANGCNPREIDDKGNCLFHHVSTYLSSQKDILFLLQLIPDMVNAINYKGKTPLDDLINASLNPDREELIGLFKQFNAKTADQLTQEKAAQELAAKQNLAIALAPASAADLEPEQIVNNNDAIGCLICFENSSKERILSLIPCKNRHADQICGDCLKTLNKCPLCCANIQNNK